MSMGWTIALVSRRDIAIDLQCNILDSNRTMTEELIQKCKLFILQEMRRNGEFRISSFHFFTAFLIN